MKLERHRDDRTSLKQLSSARVEELGSFHDEVGGVDDHCLALSLLSSSFSNCKGHPSISNVSILHDTFSGAVSEPLRNIIDLEWRQ